MKSSPPEPTSTSSARSRLRVVEAVLDTAALPVTMWLAETNEAPAFPWRLTVRSLR